MKNETNTKQSEAMKTFWIENRDYMMAKRKNNAEEIKQKQGDKIRQHFKEHPEHAQAISDAQKIKWVKYKKALAYCIENKVVL